MPYQIIESRCKRSAVCVEECPMDAISYDKEGERYTIDPDLCTECGSCADVCPEGAITGLEEG